MRSASRSAPLATTRGARHRLVVVLERDRVVGRVHDDEVGLRHRRHHSPLGHLAHARADLALDLGVAVELLVLLLQLLVAHLQPLAVQALLQRHVDRWRRRRARAGSGSSPPPPRRPRRRSPPAAAARARRPAPPRGADSHDAPMVPSTRASRLAFSASITCCLENTRPMPESGLRTCELRAERLEGPGPAAHREGAGDREDDQDQPERNDQPRAASSSSRAAASPSRRRAGPGRRRSAASARAHRAASRRRAARPTSSAMPPPPIAAKWPRSRERATWPSARAFSSLRGEAGRFLSWAELEAMRRLFQRRWQT